MANYLHRLDAIEARLGIKDCDGLPCVKCYLAKLHADMHGSHPTRCDGRPVTVKSMSAADLEQGITDLMHVLATTEATK